MRFVEVIATASIVSIAGSTAASAQECRIAATPILFGAYDTFAEFPLDGTGEILVTCAGAGPGAAPAPLIRLASGVASAGSSSPRRMLPAMPPSGAAFLAYQLYRNPTRTEVWGDGTGNTFVQTGDGRQIVYGRIPPRQSVPPGTYSDTVIVTVEW